MKIEHMVLHPMLIPTTGNEYMEHRKAKIRIANIMHQLKFVNIEMEKAYSNPDCIIDVYGEYNSPNICLGVEIDGQVGHKSKRAYMKKYAQRRDISQTHNIRILVLPVGNLDRGMDDATIKEELLNAVMK